MEINSFLLWVMGFNPQPSPKPDDSTYLKPALMYRVRLTLSLDIPFDKSLHFLLQQSYLHCLAHPHS